MTTKKQKETGKIVSELHPTDAEINKLTGNGLKRPGTNNYDMAITMQRNRDKAASGH